MGLPSVWGKWLFYAVLILLPVFFLLPALAAIAARLRRNERKGSWPSLGLYHRCMIVLLAYVMLLSPGLMESVAQGDSLYDSLDSSAWVDNDKYIEYGYWDNGDPATGNFVAGYDANGSLF